MTRPSSEFNLALYLADLGLNNCQIARVTGIPRVTVKDWRRGKRKGHQRDRYECPVCGHADLDTRSYAYLLGLYLGDGCLSKVTGKNLFRLRITLDRRYPGIIEECERAIGHVRGGSNRVGRVQYSGHVEVYANWRHWPCLFPQHGPGPKHLRQIKLATWQQLIADGYPGRLLRGLIHADGCRILNHVNGKGYPRYQFSNKSDDIRAIFCSACDVYGVAWRQSNQVTISISRATEVAKLDEAVGPKH